MLVAGYSAYPRRIDFAVMREIADEVGATLLVDMAHFAGLVAGKVFAGNFDPVPHAHVTTTTTHKSLRGPRGGMVLCQPELAEFVDKGLPVPLGEVLADQRRRDKDDSERAIVPLKPAPDAVVVDTTGMDLGEVVERCYRLARERLSAAP